MSKIERLVLNFHQNGDKGMLYANDRNGVSHLAKAEKLSFGYENCSQV
jgi:hypothetical protein